MEELDERFLDNPDYYTVVHVQTAVNRVQAILNEMNSFCEYVIEKLKDGQQPNSVSFMEVEHEELKKEFQEMEELLQQFKNIKVSLN